MNELQKIQELQMEEIGKLYPPVISAIMENIKSGESVAVAVDNGFKSTYYEKSTETITVGNTISASGHGLGGQLSLNLNMAPDYFLFTQFANGVNLSDTLHNKSSQKAVKLVLKDYFKFKGNVKELGSKLGNVNKLPNIDLPKELRELVSLSRGFMTPQKANYYQQLTRQAHNKILQLNKRGVTETAPLQKAYAKLLDKIEIGDEAGIKTALDFAFKTKVNYINSRISRTEFARSYEMSFQRRIEEDKNIIGFQWLLSSAHPKVDICDCYAESDMYGMGAGVYPKDAGANIPAHPNCLCSKVAVYDAEKKGKYSQERVDKYLKGLNDRDRKAILGADNARHKVDYKKGLESKGFKITKKPLMISKTILKRAE